MLSLADSLRILFVSDAIREPVTGVGRVAWTWMRELVALGADVVALDHEANPAAAAVCGEVHVLPCRGPLRTGRWHLNLLRRIARAKIPHDVLFDPSGYPNAWGHHPRQAVLVHDLSMLDGRHYRPGKRLWFRTFYGKALAQAQLLACVSNFTRAALVEHYRLDPDRCIVIPNALDPEFVKRSPTRPARLTTEPYFLTVGTIEARKNIPRLLQAFAEAEVPESLVLAGRLGPGAKEFEAELHRQGTRVQVLEGLDDAELGYLYRNARALLFPSLEEGFGLPILEAMAVDTPVLTSNVSAMPEVAGEAALLVDPTDRQAIRIGIERLSSDSALRQTLVDRGRQRLPAFSAERNARILLDQLGALRGST